MEYSEDTFIPFESTISISMPDVSVTDEPFQSNSFLLFDMQGEFYQSKLQPLTERFELKPFVENIPGNEKENALPPNEEDITEKREVHPWAAVAWQKPEKIKIEGPAPILHIGSHTINGKVIHTTDSPLILVRYTRIPASSKSTVVTSKQGKIYDPKGTSENFSTQSLSTAISQQVSNSENIDSIDDGKNIRWEVSAIIDHYLEFSANPVINPVKLFNLKSWLNAEPSKREPFLRKWYDQDSNTTEIWKIVLNEKFESLYNSWRLIKSDLDLLTAIKNGELTEFKLSFWTDEVSSDNNLVVCTYTSTYYAERNEHDGNIILGIKFKDSMVFPNHVVENCDTQANNGEESIGEGVEIGYKIPPTIGIPILGTVKSFLILTKGYGHTYQIDMYLKKVKRGVNKSELLKTIQASEIEILTTLTNVRLSSINSSIYYQGYWYHLDILQWYEALKYLFMACKYYLYDLSRDDITISDIIRCIGYYPLPFQFPFPLNACVIAQILRFCCFFTSPFWEVAYPCLHTPPKCKIPSNMLQSYIHFLEEEAIDCSIYFSLPKLLRFLVMCELQKNAQDFSWTPPSQLPSLQLPLKHVTLKKYMEEIITNIKEIIPSSLLMLEYSPEVIQNLRDFTNMNDLFGETFFSQQVPILNYEQWKQHTNGFPHLRHFYTDRAKFASFYTKKSDLPHESLRNDVESLIKTSQRGYDWLCKLSLFGGLLFWNTQTHTIVLLSEQMLPTTLRERLIVLFSLKSVWYEEELEYYIRPIIGHEKDVTASISGPPTHFCVLKTEQISGKFLFENEDFDEKLTKFFNWNLPISKWDIF